MPGWHRIPNDRSMVAQWTRVWRRLRLGVGGRVSVRVVGGQTHVTVEDEIPHLRVSGRVRYRITTEALQLRPDQFGSAAARFNAARRKARARTIYCLDLRSRQVLSALMFHIDDHSTLPVEINDVALRQADAKWPQAQAKSRFATCMLVDYLHEVGRRDEARSDGVVALLQDPAQVDVLRRLGFAPAAKPGFVARPGQYLVSNPQVRLRRRRW